MGSQRVYFRGSLSCVAEILEPLSFAGIVKLAIWANPLGMTSIWSAHESLWAFLVGTIDYR